MAPNVRPDCVALVTREQEAIDSLSGKDIEVVEPEVDHHFVELTLRFGGPNDSLRDEVLHEIAALLLRYLDFVLCGGGRLARR